MDEKGKRSSFLGFNDQAQTQPKTGKCQTHVLVWSSEIMWIQAETQPSCTVMGPNKGWSLHTFSMNAWPLESSPLTTQGVFIQGETLAQCNHKNVREKPKN